MKGRLFIFGRFADDPQRILAAICQFALMSGKGTLDGLLRIAFELQNTALANTEHRRGFSRDSEFALRHGFSLTHAERL